MRGARGDQFGGWQWGWGGQGGAGHSGGAWQGVGGAGGAERGGRQRDACKPLQQCSRAVHVMVYVASATESRNAEIKPEQQRCFIIVLEAPAKT